jgi:hypothetical protein
MAEYYNTKGERLESWFEAHLDAIRQERIDNSSSIKLEKIKELRNQRLKNTDWMASSDYSMPDYIKTWRQTLRDLPQNNTTESQYDTLLERNTNGTLKNSVWTQPTE